MRKAPFSRWLPGVSRGTLAGLLLAAPAAASAAGFAGSYVIAPGSSATITSAGNVQTVSLPTNSPVTTINWTPSDTATSASVSNAPINFLPNGQTVSYVGAAGASVPYTVLNRIIPTDTTRIVGFNGTVQSTPNTRVWFYSPGGLLIGSTANFYVGGLVLTAADPVVDGNGNFITTTAGTDNFSLVAAANSTSAITIQPGANIEALTSGQSNYIVAIAPQINQGGKISVAGSVALVAAESATFAVDSHGLFNITVDAGTTVADNTFVHSGITGGPNVDPSGNYQRVYMVAVPKNNAISMAIASGGTIGFSVADAANVDGNEIVLSAGSNIADTGSGNPVVAGRVGGGTAALTVGGGNYSSNTYAVSTDSVTVTDPALDIGFASNLAVLAPQATVNAQAGTISVGGNLTVDADDTLTGRGGTASLQANYASITVAGDTLVSAVGSWGGGTQNNGYDLTQGGTAQVTVNGGNISIGGGLTVNANGDATDSYAALASGIGNAGANATGGMASVTVGNNGTLTASNGIAASADAISSYDGYGDGGFADGGTALIEAISGGTIGVDLNGVIGVSAAASVATPSLQFEYGYGGSATGGTAQVIASEGTITLAGVNGITANASAMGGTAPAYSGSGGSATGGTALIATQGASGTIITNTSGSTGGSDFSTRVEASAQGGDATGFYASDHYQGGTAIGGTATVQVSGAGQSIAIDRGAQILIDAHATGGAGFGQAGGDATGGSAQLLSSGGSIAITNTGLTISASAQGGNDDIGTGGNGGNAIGGTVRMAASDGGTIDANIGTFATASAVSGAGSGNGGNALGGNILIALGNNDFNFGSAGQAIELDASFTAGAGQYGSPGTAASGGGVLLTDLGTVTLGGNLTIDNNTPFYAQAGGSLNVSGSISETNTGAYVHLWADDLGTGAGTVTLANGALNLPGSQIDIFYNPGSLGSPTDFSGGISAGTWTGYQLVDNIDQLQSVGSYLSQNFALGRNIDGSATQGWNDGAGFVPIGSTSNGFTGNFDGLNHTVTNLYVNTPANIGVGLFGAVDTSNNSVLIRNVNLSHENITGNYFVGGLLGLNAIPAAANNNQLIIQNVSSSGQVSGATYVGGLVGALESGDQNVVAAVLSNSHSDASVVGIQSANGNADLGGLAGLALGAELDHVFATGSVTAPAASSVGGLVGAAFGGSATGAYATGAVAVGNGSIAIGGLFGSAEGTAINLAYAVGSVTAGTGSNLVGGLVGGNSGTVGDPGTITESWASGAVAASGSTNVGGLVGSNGSQGTITNSYWDTYSTGQAAGAGGNSGTVTQLNPVTSDPSQIYGGSYAFDSNSYANFSYANWTYDNYQTRPVGTWETPVAQFGVATINSAHQVQLIDFNMAGNYTIAQNIDMKGTGGTTDIWGPGGFMPLGGEYVDPPFTGTLDGAGHVLSNLTMDPEGAVNYTGLVQQNYGTIRDLGLANINVTDSYSFDIGTLAGINAGQIIDSFATGTITLSQNQYGFGVAGGLVGLNSDGSSGGTSGSITQSYASVVISGGSSVGGLVGDNEGAISTSYANGAVSGLQTGGLVGQSTNDAGPSVTNSYWDTQLTGQDVGCGSDFSGACSGATGLTTAQTLQSDSFSGFTIDTAGGQGMPWRQYEGQSTPLLEAFLTPVSVQPGSLTTQYNAQTPDVGVTTYGADPALTFGTAQVDGLTQNAGTSYLTYAGGLYSNQLGYDFVPSTNPGTLVITPAPLTLTATSDTRVYDGTINSTGLVQSSGLYGEDTVSSLSQSFTSPNVMGTSGSTLVVNPGYAINDGNGGNNYSVTLQSAQGTITPAALTLAAVSDTKVYDATTNSAGVVQVSGLVGTDDVASLTQSFTSPNAMGVNGSTLVVNPGYVVEDGNGGNNYSVTLQGAQGTITPAQLMLTLAAVSDTKVYDGTVYSSGMPQTIGLMGTDNVTNLSQSFTSPNVMGVNGSTLVVNPGYVVNDGNGGGNYSVTLQSAQGTITPAALAITYAADRATSIYGSTIAPLSGSTSATGLQGQDTLASVTSGTASFNTAATAQSGVGRYAVTGSGLTGNSGNYIFSFFQSTINPIALTITPRALTLTADPLSRSYGSANPTSDTATAAPATATTGLVNGDFVTSEAVSSPATAGSGVGSYALDGSAAQFGSGAGFNYAITYATNTAGLTITPAALTLTYTANPGSSTYGQAPAGLTGTTSLTGLVNGDSAAAVTDGSALWTSPATATSSVGTYAINGSGIGLANANYSLTTVQAAGNATALTINPASATITYTANAASTIYGNTTGGLTGSESASGLVNGDTLAGVTTGTASFATTATSASNIGAYGVTGSGLASSNGNYSFSVAQAPGNATALTITPRPITVTADPQQRATGAGNPVFTYALTGPIQAATGTTAPALVNGDTLTGQLASPATATSPAGTYDILQGNLAASANYRLTYVGNILTVGSTVTPTLSIVDIGNMIEANLVDQTDPATPESRRKQQEAELAALFSGLGLHPPQITQSMINDRLVTTPPPVNEAVTSNGNSSLWSPGAP